MLRALRACDGVFGSSVDVARRLGEAAGLDDVGVFYGGVPEVEAATPGEPPLILWVGRMEPAKDPDRLVRATSILRQGAPPFRVAMVGGAHPGSSYFDEFRQRVQAQGLESVVDLPGYVDDETLEGYYSDAAICVQTSLTEGMSQGVLEQMMRGMAIVATDVGDTGVALDAGRCGVLIEPDAAPEVLAMHLRHLLNDPTERSRLGQAARARALEAFSIEAMVERARSIYERGRAS
jgi:glycosyltransferase involved in cell wall biosynthesis